MLQQDFTEFLDKNSVNESEMNGKKVKNKLQKTIHNFFTVKPCNNGIEGTNHIFLLMPKFDIINKEKKLR